MSDDVEPAPVNDPDGETDAQRHQSGIADAPFGMFFRFVVWSVFWTVVVTTCLLTLVVTVSEGDIAAWIPVWMITILAGFVFAIPVVAITAVLGFPIWKFIHRVTAALPGRVALIIGADLVAVLAGAVLALVSLFDLDLAVSPAVDLAVFVVVGGVCGTLVAWRIYADWL